MNLSRPASVAARLINSAILNCRLWLPRTRCHSFVPSSDIQASGIGPIFVINLDRQPNRWSSILRELTRILDADDRPLSDRVVRYAACDAQDESERFHDSSEVDPFYTLGDQLFVEPQPLAAPDRFDLTTPIRMSRAEVAVALSHIGVWRTLAQSSDHYALVLEDDVSFKRCFGRVVDHAWREMSASNRTAPSFDLWYLSYKEARYGAPKELLSSNVFRPERGLWYLSGYVLSRRGARKLLGLLPCRGPIDLWINHKFTELEVRAIRRPVANQRLDALSSNSYSILPMLGRIGVLDHGGSALFNQKPRHSPVFAFGSDGLSSVAVALSMLGYRCCSDLDQIPHDELINLMAGTSDRVFNAYVNIGSLEPLAATLVARYPSAKFIVTGDDSQAADALLNTLEGADVLRLRRGNSNSWRAVCEHVELSPPPAAYPVVRDLGLRRCIRDALKSQNTRAFRYLRHDRSPWIVESSRGWEGITASVSEASITQGPRVVFESNFRGAMPAHWLTRSDTFPGNLGLFRPGNVRAEPTGGLRLSVFHEPLGVRDFSAAAVSSRDRFLYGRFEATLQATAVSGLVTGFFLHRNSPRQEIDVEITGNRPTRLLVNVFYNPGPEGAQFDYGYRGTPVAIPLSFDASKNAHRFAIEWDPFEIRWFVDDQMVHRRVMWNPTPIPDLPMTLHVNTWPTRSSELAGRLAVRSLPGVSRLHKVAVDTFKPGTDCGAS